MKRRWIILRVSGAVALAALWLLTIALPIMAATPEPDSVSVTDITIFKDLIDTDDYLAFVPYKLVFTTPPDESADKTFIFRFLTTDNVTLGSVLANPAYNDGYGSGAVSFYFASGMTWEESYILRVQENPTYYPDAQYWDFSIGASNYSDESDQTTALKAAIIDSAKYLTGVFDTQLLTTSESGSTVLSTYGELYYLNVIPGLQTMCPTLFSVQLENPDYTKRSWDTTFADTLYTKYSGTFVYDFMTGFSGLFSMDTPAAMGILCIMLFAVVIFISVWKFKASMLSGFIDGYTVLLLLMLFGYFPMIGAGAIAFASVVLGGIILFLNRA